MTILDALFPLLAGLVTAVTAYSIGYWLGHARGRVQGRIEAYRNGGQELDNALYGRVDRTGK